MNKRLAGQSHLTPDEVSEISNIPAGLETAGFDADLDGGVLFDEVERHRAHDGEIVGLRPVRARLLSSSKATSMTQCSWFSMHQWVLTVARNLAASGGREVR